jgi:hypothetical protein
MMHHHHHQHSPAMRIVCMVSWLVTALSSLFIGLDALGAYMGKDWNIWHSDFIMNHLPALVQPLMYLIGLCGLFSLISFFMCCGSCKADKR